MTKNTDEQQYLVYAWERCLRRRFRKYDLNPKLDLATSKSLVINNLKKFGVGSPSFILRDGRGTRRPFAGYNIINLPVFSRSPLRILHEVTHMLQCRLSIDGEWHGGEFVRLFANLVHQNVGVKEEAVVSSAKYFGIKVESKKKVAQLCNIN